MPKCASQVFLTSTLCFAAATLIPIQESPMAWIKTIPFDAATGKLKALYQRVTGPGNNVVPGDWGHR